jgi:hypothetical protein
MKTKITIIILSVVIAILVFSVSDNLYSNHAGAPAQVTGSPADGQTCNKSNCHTGNSVVVTPGIINSNIPITGYVSGTTYTITATVTQTGNSCWGFEISPQNLAGTLLGIPVITDTGQTKIINLKYITHKLAGTSGANTKSWSFNWVAPAAGTGDVTFYGAFNYCNGNNLRTGDFIHTSFYTVNEATVGINENAEAYRFLVFPNPISTTAEISFYLPEKTSFNLILYTIGGKKIQTLAASQSFKGSYIYYFENQLNKGMYLLSIETPSSTVVKKIVIQ